jgi:hypothetical protein
MKQSQRNTPPHIRPQTRLHNAVPQSHNQQQKKTQTVSTGIEEHHGKQEARVRAACQVVFFVVAVVEGHLYHQEEDGGCYKVLEEEEVFPVFVGNVRP